MKKNYGKFIVALVAAVAILMAVAAVASAASITSVTPVVGEDEGKTITVTVVYADPAEAQQSTIVVVPAGVALTALEDSNIKYINQESVSDTTVAYTFKLKEADRTGEYTVYVGGTAVDAPEDASFAFSTTPPVTGYKIVGTISIIEGASFTTASAVAGTIQGTVADNGAFEIPVENGTYAVVLGRTGYLYRTVSDVVVADADKNLGAISLMAGDIGNDSVIDLSDLQPLLSAFLKAEAYDAACDFNDDSVIDLSDLQPLLSNFLKGYTD